MTHIKDPMKEYWEKLAIQAIGVVDYDIGKECEWNLAVEGHDPLVSEMAHWLEETFGT